MRDKVNSTFDIRIKNTRDLIEKIQNDELPDKIMMNVHPQRWNDPGFQWYKELVGQNIKNQIKRILVRRTEDGRRMTENRRQKTEGGRRRMEGGCLAVDNRG